MWLVDGTSIENLKLYIGTIEHPIYLTGQSQDGESIKLQSLKD